MALITDNDPQSNDYLFITGFSYVLGAGKNGFTVNETKLVNTNIPLSISAADSSGKVVQTGLAKPTNSKFGGQTATGTTYYIRIDSTASTGIGTLTIRGKLVDGNEFVWSRNVLIEPSRKNNSFVTFFDFPKVSIRQEIFLESQYPTCNYSMASGTFYGTAVVPRNNLSGDYDYHFDEPIYQIFKSTGTSFNSMMEGEKIRLTNVTVKKFSYTNFANNNVTFEGTLNTDFITTIKRVVSSGSILLDMPFSTVSEIIDNSNLDSPYTKNNLVDIKGYSPENNPTKQGSFHKKNFYVLSLDSGNFEVVYKNIPYLAVGTDKKLVLNIDVYNIRTMCGQVSRYRIYKKSLNYPQSSVEILSGKVEPNELISSTNFTNGVYNLPGRFYNQAHLDRFWLSSGGGLLISQNSGVLIDGAKISHTGNTNQMDYVIFKDDTSVGRTSTYIQPNVMANSHWYGINQVFNNGSVLPNSTYSCASSIPSISPFVASQENLTTGAIHDSNPIKLMGNTLYQFSMRVRSVFDNSNSAKMYVYFISGTSKIQIGTIDSSFNYGANESYKNTFFVDTTKFGTIMLVPVQGGWNISELSLVPYSDNGYSPDSFSIKIPMSTSVDNELIEVEVELLDGKDDVAYGEGSDNFLYNRVYSPLKQKIFLNPDGQTVQ